MFPAKGVTVSRKRIGLKPGMNKYFGFLEPHRHASARIPTSGVNKASHVVPFMHVYVICYGWQFDKAWRMALMRTAHRLLFLIT